jgi:hypothetical protein
MAYSQTNSKGQQYFLHMKDVTLKGGRLPNPPQPKL